MSLSRSLLIHVVFDVHPHGTRSPVRLPPHPRSRPEAKAAPPGAVHGEAVGAHPGLALVAGGGGGGAHRGRSPGPARYCSPRYVMPLNSKHEGIKRGGCHGEQYLPGPSGGQQVRGSASRRRSSARSRLSSSAAAATAASFTRFCSADTPIHTPGPGAAPLPGVAPALPTSW